MPLTAAEKSARYRAKDVDAYRTKKAEYARSPEQRAKRTEYMRAWREKNREAYNKYAEQRRRKRGVPCKPVRTPEEIRERKRLYAAKWRAANREKHIANNRASYHRYKERYRAKIREYHLKKKYGITAAEWDALFESQGKKCKICNGGDPRNTRGWHLDHDHVTGAVRGVLCHVCNTKLGWLEKYRESIHSYLKAHG